MQEQKIRLIKLFNIVGKILILLYLLVNLFNLFPLELSNPRWASNISLLIVDTSTIIFLGIALIKFSILKKEEQLMAIGAKKELNINFKKELSLSKFIYLIISFFAIICLLQINILFRGLNLLDLQSKIALEKVETNFKTRSSFNSNNTNNAETIKKQYNQSKQLIFDSAKISKQNLISQRLKVVFISILICFALRLIQTL